MTVENLLSLLVSNPPPPLGQKLALDPQSLAVMTAHLQTQPARHMPIPARTRHQSWSSTGSMGSGKSSPLSTSPPLHDVIGVHFAFGGSGVQITSPRATGRLERCLSMTSAAPEQSQKNVNPTRYKTEMCRPFEESGHCKYGDKCQFAHGRHELRNLSRHPKYKTELCRTYHTVGFCPYGPRCHFIHNEDELKLTEITHLKHQQMLQQVAQQVAQHQPMLPRLALPPAPFPTELGKAKLAFLPPQVTSQSCPLSRLPTLDFSSLSLGSTIDSPPASVSDGSSPSLSPTSMLSEEVFSGVPTPPPGFSALPPTIPTRSGVFTFHEVGAPPQRSSYPGSFCMKSSTEQKSEYSPVRCSTPVDIEPPKTPHKGEVPSTSTSPIRLPIFSRLSIDN